MLTRSTHATLIERLSRPDAGEAWREFLDRYGDLIRGFGRRRGLSDSDSDDLVQDVLTSLVSALPKFRYDPGKGRFRGYLKTIAVREILRRRCQNGRPQPLAEMEALADSEASSEAVDSQWETEWRQYHMRVAMASIEAEFSVSDRAAFRRYAIEGQGTQQVADALGLSADAVYQAKSRILKRLSQLIAAQVADEG